jgi:protein-S-isoprenylcysteine O-methyltransferase Ste14
MNKTPTVSSSPSFFVRMGYFFFHYRGGLFPALLLLLVLAVHPAQFGGNLRLDLVAVVVGTVVALIGQVIRCATIGLVYVKRGGQNHRIYASTLTTEGIYAHTRNPMYLGNIMIAGGLCLVYGSAWTYAAAFSFFLLVYICITLAEEHHLRSQFGNQFDAYCRATNRFWPRMKGLGRTLTQHRFKWKAVVYKEHGNLLGFFLGLYIVMLLKYYRVYAPSPIPERPLLLVIPLVPLFALYGIARWLKKSNRT